MGYQYVRTYLKHQIRRQTQQEILRFEMNILLNIIICRKVLFDQGVLKLLNGLGSKPLNVQSDFRFRPDNKSHDVPFSDGGGSNPGCFPGPVGRSVCSNASLASPHDYLSKRFTEQSERTT
ncbi:LOW QUALITY PROTEIN: hypothetical protein V1477_014878 [Vespula maculifrons]|uniref:Uncharacterized protein n=1 Tax=Vespula maculifrons TaxID=7453 RepID=A0ABD2BIQ7_VESMC